MEKDIIEKYNKACMTLLIWSFGASIAMVGCEGDKLLCIWLPFPIISHWITYIKLRNNSCPMTIGIKLFFIFGESLMFFFGITTFGIILSSLMHGHIELPKFFDQSNIIEFIVGLPLFLYLEIVKNIIIILIYNYIYKEKIGWRKK